MVCWVLRKLSCLCRRALLTCPIHSSPVLTWQEAVWSKCVVSECVCQKVIQRSKVKVDMLGLTERDRRLLKHSQVMDLIMGWLYWWGEEYQLLGVRVWNYFLFIYILHDKQSCWGALLLKKKKGTTSCYCITPIHTQFKNYILQLEINANARISAHLN